MEECHPYGCFLGIEPRVENVSNFCITIMREVTLTISTEMFDYMKNRTMLKSEVVSALSTKLPENILALGLGVEPRSLQYKCDVTELLVHI